jgi:hypothetical protein
MSITHGYASVLEFKDHLQDPRIDDEDPAVERVIESGARIIDAYTHRRFYADTVASVRRYKSTPWTSLFVDDYVELISVTPEASFGVLGTAYDPTSYQVAPYNAAVSGWPYNYIDNEFSRWGTYVHVEAKWGWPSTLATITQANLMISARLWKRRESINGTLGFDEFALRLPATDPDVANMLAPYRFTPVLVG